MEEISIETTNYMIYAAIHRVKVRREKEEIERSSIRRIYAKPVGKWEDMGLNGDMYRKMMAEYLKRTGYKGW